MAKSRKATSSAARGTTRSGPLALLGLGDSEERVYEALLNDPGASLADVARAVGLGRTAADAALRDLERAGLLSRVPTRPQRFLPAAPQSAVETLIRKQQETFEAARLQAWHLQERFRLSDRARRSPLDLIEVVTDVQTIVERMHGMEKEAQQEALAFMLPPFATGTDEGVALTAETLERGVTMRTIYDPEVLELPGELASIRACAGLGEQCRVGPVPMKMLIVDHRVALVPLRVGDIGDRSALEGAIFVNASPLLDALIVLFESLWKQAERLPFDPRTAVPDGRLDETDKAIVTLLATGQQDAAIARTLALSHRTVGRRIALMMQRLGVRTRFQLGRCLQPN